MYRKIYIVIFISTLLIIFTSCSKNKNGGGAKVDLTGQLDYAKNIKDFINEVKVQEINLDLLKPKILEPQEIIGKVSAKNKKFFIGQAWDCTVIGDSVYIVDTKLKSIIVADKYGRLVRKIGREGGGPGEFEKPMNITNNNDYVAIYDSRNWSVDLFDIKFRFLKKIRSSTRAFSRGIGMDNKYLYCKTFFFRKEANIDVFSLNKDSLGKYIQSIYFPLLGKPQTRNAVMNSSTFAVNKDGYIFYAYVGIPYLFIYDNHHKHCASIKFNAKFFKKELEAIKLPFSKYKKMFIFKYLIQTVDAYKNNIYILFNPNKLFTAKLNDKNILVDFHFYELKGKNNPSISTIKIINKKLCLADNNNLIIVKYILN